MSKAGTNWWMYGGVALAAVAFVGQFLQSEGDTLSIAILVIGLLALGLLAFGTARGR